VMEGKAALFKEFADIDAYPICVDAAGPAELIAVAKAIARVRGASTWRTWPPRPASRSRSAPPGARHPGVPRRPARHRGGRPGRAGERLPGGGNAPADLR
jgi:hypothetical protein